MTHNYVIPQAMPHAIPQTHSAFYPHRLKTNLANLRFLSFEKGEACQSILIMFRGKIGSSKPEEKKIGCV